MSDMDALTNVSTYIDFGADTDYERLLLPSWEVCEEDACDRCARQGLAPKRAVASWTSIVDDPFGGTDRIQIDAQLCEECLVKATELEQRPDRTAFYQRFGEPMQVLPRPRATGMLAEVGGAELCRRLQSEREQRGLNQAEAAREIGVHPNTVRNWESGNCNLQGKSLQKLRRWMGKNPSVIHASEVEQ